MAISPRADADRLLDDLNVAQREAVLATSGPVAILAGAGTGKTRVISRRTAYAIATGVVAADQALVVTFTDKAAGEMVARLAGLGLRGVAARTFHAHALSQLRFFWPSRHGGEPLPALLDSKVPFLSRSARGLPGHFRFTPIRDLATEIEWAKARGIDPAGYEAAIGARTPPIPADLMRRVFSDYERAKARAGRIDFDDLLAATIALIETDTEAAELIHARKTWFSVDEYQDTNPHQERLLELWAGDRDDICVVGDEDQTIYTFTGASSAYLTGFAERHDGARVIALTENYRSTPQILGFANRLLAGAGRSKVLTARRPDGPPPSVERYADGDVELTALTRQIRGLLVSAEIPAGPGAAEVPRPGADAAEVADPARLVGAGSADPARLIGAPVGSTGFVAAEIAILVRMNAQFAPIEEALTRAGIAYQVRGVRFYDRPEVTAALGSIRRLATDATGRGLATAIRAAFREELGHEPGDAAGVADRPGGDEARERTAALDTVLAIIDESARANPAVTRDGIRTELERRAAHEREGAADGVTLSTYHRAKGLEWDAVFLPMLEDGTLPIRQAFDDDGAIAEERRLLYVGITRARRVLRLSWADRRETRGREARRTRSRFLAGLVAPGGHPPSSANRLAPGPAPARLRRVVGEDPLFDALRAWRTDRAREQAVPAYVVAGDETLAAIAAARPSSLAALERVRGIGPAKVDRYGSDILAIVATVPTA